MRRRDFLPFLLLPLAAACAGSSGPVDAVTYDGDTVRGTGTIQWNPIEGGFYYIAGDDNKGYDPTNLPPAFRSRGLRVRFEIRVRNDMVGIHMAGPIVDVISMERL